MRLWTRPELIWAGTRAEHPHGYENLGASHGAPGVMAVLAQAATSGAVAPGQAASARAVAAGLAARLMSLALPGPARYPAWVSPDKQRTGSRVAWCYGDLGVACALLVTARALGDGAVEAHAIDTARLAAARPIAEAGVQDAGLCHGSIGNALLLARLAQESDDVALADAARRYFLDGLSRRRHGQGTAGFLARMPGGDVPDVSFLTGAAGIGLGLLAAVTELEPAWDVVLAASAVLRR
jgi:lantibiotic modifying enzyme